MRQHTVVDKNFIRPSRRVPCVPISSPVPLRRFGPPSLTGKLAHWLPITKVTWTSRTLWPGNHCVRPTPGVSEVFHEWVEGAFYFAESNLPVRA